jgi:hypothetical protein
VIDRSHLDAIYAGLAVLSSRQASLQVDSIVEQRNGVHLLGWLVTFYVDGDAFAAFFSERIVREEKAPVWWQPMKQET